MTDLPQKRALKDALEQMAKEVKSWPEWKQQLVSGKDFRIEHEHFDDRIECELVAVSGIQQQK